MKNKPKCRLNPPPTSYFYPYNKGSIRGKKVNLEDGTAIYVACVSVLTFLLFSFFLGVIISDPKAEENEKNNGKPQEIEKFIDWVVK
jgi:hypothetical protein